MSFMDGSHLSPQQLMAFFLFHKNKMTWKRHLDNPSKWSTPRFFTSERDDGTFGPNNSLWSVQWRKKYAEHPNSLPLLAYLGPKGDPLEGFLLATYVDHGRLSGQQVCLATTRGELYVPGDHVQIPFYRCSFATEQELREYESQVHREAQEFVAVVDALYHEAPVPAAQPSVLAAGPMWGLWHDEYHTDELTFSEIFRPFRKRAAGRPTTLTDAGRIWLMAHRRAEGQEIYAKGAPKKEVPTVHIGDGAFVSMIGDNAQGVAVGSGASATVTNTTTDVQLIGMVVDALKAAGHTKDAETLQIVADQAGPRHPATAAIGQTVWKSTKEVLTAALPNTVTALFKALIGL